MQKKFSLLDHPRMRKHLEAALWTAVVAAIVVFVIFQLGPLRRAITTGHLGKLSA